MRSEMVNAMTALADDKTSNLHVAIPGTITGYSNGMCQVKPIGSMTKPDGTSMEYPVMAGIPLCSPAGIAVPVKAGTNCLLIICDSDIAGWISGKNAAASMPHSLQNAVCIPELRRTPNAMQEYANSHGCVAISGNLYVSGNIEVGGGVKSKGNVDAPNVP